MPEPSNLEPVAPSTDAPSAPAEMSPVGEVQQMVAKGQAAWNNNARDWARDAADRTGMPKEAQEALQEGLEDAPKNLLLRGVESLVYSIASRAGLGLELVKGGWAYISSEDSVAVNGQESASAQDAINACNQQGKVAKAAVVTASAFLGGPVGGLAGWAGGDLVADYVTGRCISNIPPEVLASANEAVGGNANQLACTAVDAPDGACVPKANAPTPQRAGGR